MVAGVVEGAVHPVHPQPGLPVVTLTVLDSHLHLVPYIAAVAAALPAVVKDLEY